VSTIYFCWLCDQVADDTSLAVRDPEKPRELHNFCSLEHQASYLWLQNL
jgi:hypothetical protein